MESSSASTKAFVLGFEGFDLFYMADAHEIVSVLSPSPVAAGPTGSEDTEAV
jgi:hypothetical protein